MPPIFSYECVSCSKVWDELRHSREKDDPATCSKCEAPANRRITAPGGYNGDTGTASTRPKRAASRGSGEQLAFDFAPRKATDADVDRFLEENRDLMDDLGNK